MKPLRKAMKIAHYEHQNKETVLNQLLTSYQATPHIATDQTLGNLFFQLDYQHNFHTAKPPTSNYIKEAHATAAAKQKLNASRISKISCMEPGQLILVKHFKCDKFHSYCHPQQCKVLQQDQICWS